MKACAIISALCIISLVSAMPARSGMLFYNMPYYNPYHQAMLVHYAPHSFGRAGTSAFATGDKVAAGTQVREHQVPLEEAPVAVAQEQSSNDEGNVEAIAEAYPEEPIQGTVQFDQGEEQYNEVVPLSVVIPAASDAPVDNNENVTPVVQLAPEPEKKAEEPQYPPQVLPLSTVAPVAPVAPVASVAPKKKVHIALDIPDKQEENDYDEADDQFGYAPQKPGKPSRNGGSPTYTFFPVSFGRAAGGTIAVANAYSTGKGAVRSHAIAYGSTASSRRQQASERHATA